MAALLDHKHALTSSPLHSIPPTYLNLSSPSSSHSSPTTTESTPSPMSLALTETLTSSPSPTRFDSILLTPPPSTTYEELKSLDLGRVAANPGFVWLWVGSGQQSLSGGGGEGLDGIGLEKGRELLSLWGYRRCEDIVWLKTNKRDPEADLVREVSCRAPLFFGVSLRTTHSRPNRKLSLDRPPARFSLSPPRSSRRRSSIA